MTRGQGNTPERVRRLFELLGLLRLKDATVPELRAAYPEYPVSSLYVRIRHLTALRWLHERGTRRHSKREKSAQVWGITRAGIIMLHAWENAEELLRWWPRDSEEP